MKMYGVLVVLGCLMASSSYAADAMLTWNANTESDLAGYRIYRSNQNCAAQGPLAPLMVGSPSVPAEVGSVVTTFIDSTLPAFDGEFCWEISAFDTSQNISGRSNRVSKVLNTLPPVAPAGLDVVIQ